MRLPQAAGAGGVRRRRGHLAPRVGLFGLVQALTGAVVAAAAPVAAEVSVQGIGPLALGIPLVEASRQTVALVCGAPGSVERFARRLFIAGVPRGQVFADVFVEHA